MGRAAATVSIGSVQIITAPRTSESSPALRSGSARIEIAAGAEPVLEAAGLGSLEAALDPAIGAAIAASRSSWVRRVPAGARAVYVKCFVYPTVKDVVLRIVSRRFLWHRARREWRSIGLQEKLGLPVVRRLCLGELRRGGILRASVIVTEEFEGAARFDLWLRGLDGAEAAGIAAAAAAARYVALLHERGFVHGDLNARNVLVGGDDATALDFRNVDSGRGRRRPWRGRIRRGHLDDVAPLAIAFRSILGAAAESAFVRAYAARLGVALTDATTRRLARVAARIAPRELRRLSAAIPEIDRGGIAERG